MKKGFMTALALGIMIIVLPMVVSAYTDSAITRTTFDNGKYIVDSGVAEDGSVVIFAGYNGDALAYVDYRIKDEADGSDMEFAVPDTVDYNSAKVFVWDSLDNMSPMAPPESIKVSKITPETEFAVVDSVSIDPIGKIILNVFNSEGFKTLEVSNNLALPELTRGDVVVLGMNSAEQIVEIEKLYTVDNSEAAVEDMWSAPKIKNPYTLKDSHHFIQSGIEAWDNTDMNDDVWARVGFGIILDTFNGGVTMATVKKASDKDVVYSSGILMEDRISLDDMSCESDCDNVEEFVFADDMNVYVYDDYYRPELKIKKGNVADIIKTFVPTMCIFTVGEVEIYNWEMYYVFDLIPNYAFYKITNDVITDIIVIKPAID